MLFRNVYSGSHKKGKLTAGLFTRKQSQKALSVSRASFGSREDFVTLGRVDALLRAQKSGNDIKFYGFAKLRAGKIASIRLKDQSIDRLLVLGKPTKINPLHANIELPPYKSKDLDLMIIDALLNLAEPDLIDDPGASAKP